MSINKSTNFIIITVGCVIVLIVCIGNYYHQRDIVRKYSGTGYFEEIERAKWRSGDGGYKAIFGIFPTLVSYVSEDLADSISESIFGTSRRKGKGYASRYNENIERIRELQGKITEGERRRNTIDDQLRALSR